MIRKQRKTPQVNFDSANGRLDIAGESYPENAIETYQPIFNWLIEYISSTTNKIIINFKLGLLNLSSTKCILNVMEKLEETSKTGRQIELNWYYQVDDLDMLITGQAFAVDISLPFNLIPF